VLAQRQNHLQLPPPLLMPALEREVISDGFELSGERERLEIDMRYLDRIEAVSKQVDNHFYR
jgi:hypothetical protein